MILNDGVITYDGNDYTVPKTHKKLKAKAYMTNLGSLVLFDEVGGIENIPPTYNFELVSELEIEPYDELLLKKMKKDLLGIINEDTNNIMFQLDNDYPEKEVLTWDQQVIEAQSIKNGEQDHCYMLKGIAEFRDLNLNELADRVIAKSNMYKKQSGIILGLRQKLEDMIDGIKNKDDLSTIPSMYEIFEQHTNNKEG